MMIVSPITNGIVLDHIKAGNAMELYKVLHLDKLECPVAILKNVDSQKMGRKDIIKVDATIDLDLDAIGYVDPNATVNIIKNGELVEKQDIGLPEKLVDIIRCKNPRCITTTEQELTQIFVLTDRKTGTYRCRYCETKAER